MLVGPTPGVEYPLDRERMTIGRAEDAQHLGQPQLRLAPPLRGARARRRPLRDRRQGLVERRSRQRGRAEAQHHRGRRRHRARRRALQVRRRRTGLRPRPEREPAAHGDQRSRRRARRPASQGLGRLRAPDRRRRSRRRAHHPRVRLSCSEARANTDTPQGGGITSAPDTEQAIVAEAKRTCTPDDCDAAYQQLWVCRRSHRGAATRTSARSRTPGRTR